ncbi:MAG: LysR substrate-binding domain-containing protein [Polaromonas sp.]
MKLHRRRNHHRLPPAHQTPFLSLRGRSRLISIVCDDMGALRQLAQTSHAVILAPHDAAQSAAPDPSLVRLEIDLSEPLHTHYGIVTLAQRNPSPAAQVFMRLVHEVLEGASSH